MSEVHRYQVVTMLSAAGATIVYDPHGPDVVMAVEFDRVTAENSALQALLTAADERADVLERVEARYRWLQKATSYRLKKLQESSVTDGGDVLYFHADRFDALVDAAMKAGDQW